MNILFFTNEYAHPDLPAAGGVGSFLKTLAKEFTDNGHTIHVFGFSKKNKSFKEGKIQFHFFKKYSKSFPISEGVRSITSRMNIKSAELYFLKKERKYLANKLKKYAELNNIDIIESFVFNGYTAFWDNSTPLVLRFHGSRGFWHYYLNQEKDELKISMEQKALEATPYTVAVSNFSANAVKKIYSINVDKVIHNGIDHKLFSPIENIKKIPQSIFYFGTLSNAKGVDKLCQVFNQTIEEFPKASLHIIGRGNSYWENECQDLLSKKALKSTKYYGPKNNNHLPKIISQATICIFATKNENFSLAIEEAMALKIPLIASNIEATEEIIDHKKNGFLANSIEDYLDYIKLLFKNDDLRKSIGDNARLKIQEKFTKEKMAQQTLDYYQEILAD